MADDRGLELYRNYSSMEVGLDRLLLGISLAICGYLGQTVEFGRIGWNVPTGNLLVMLLFVLSSAFGVRRLERTRDTAKLNLMTMEIERLIRKVGQQSTHREEMENGKETVESQLTGIMRQASFAYNARNGCMFLGLLSYVALKVVAAY